MTDAAAAAAPRPVTHRRILTIAGPIVLSNATVPILGAVDTGVVGQLGAAAPIGAVGLGAIILTSFYWIFGFLRMGTVGLTAQALGRDDEGEAAAILLRGLLVAGIGGAAIIVCQLPLFALAFGLAPASAEVEPLARDYMAIRVWSAPALISTYALTGWLIAKERTWAILVLQIWMNGLNIVLDLWFVLGLGWGVTGVAWATFAAEWSGAALGLWLCRGAFAAPGWRDPARIADPAKLKRFAQVNGDILIRTLLLQSVFTSFLFLAAGQGDVKLAANQVLLQFLYITSYAMDGFAFAVESLVGQALARRQRAVLRRAAILCAGWSVGIGLVLSLVFALGGGALIDLMATAPDVRAEARTYLPWMVLAPVFGAAAFILDGIFIGATRTADMRNMMLVSVGLYFAAVFPLIAAFGNHGLWLALLFSFAVRGLTLALRYPALEAEAA